MRSTASRDTSLYRAALYLYPPAFRREFSSEMIRDFEEAREDTSFGPRRTLWRFRAHMGADLLRSVVRQWRRSGWPVIAAASVIGPLTAAAALATVWRWTPFVLPIGTADADLIALELVVVIVLLVIVATILFTLWLTHPLFRRRRA